MYILWADVSRVMARSNNHSWITVDTDSESPLRNERNEPKKLSQMCAETLVSDVSIISQYELRLPKLIHSLILSAALDKRRILSIKLLLNSCPQDCLELPIPDYFKTLHSVYNMRKEELDNEMRQLARISVTMLSAFFDIITKNNTNSSLRVLDLSIFPVGKAALDSINDFLFKARKKVQYFATTYTLKCAVAIENSKDLHILIMCAENAIKLGFVLDITGIYFYNNYFPDVHTVRLFDFLKVSNLQFIGFNFADLVPSFDLFFNDLQYFKMVKYLNLSYLSDFFSSDIAEKAFAKSLRNLSHLQRLVLRGVTLTNKLTMLFLGNCKKHLDRTTTNCCFVHNTSLNYLDVSSCRLTNDDLEFLKEMASTNSLKYLDMSHNSLCEKRTFDILLHLKTSLRALNISSCFTHQIAYDDVSFPFSAFTKLRYLNIENLPFLEGTTHLLELELQKMPKLEILESSNRLSLNIPVIH